MFRIQQIAIAAIVAAALASPVVAQQQQNYSQVTQADVQRLQDSVFQAGSDVQQLKSRDAARAAQLQAQLDDLRDEVIYLKVSCGKGSAADRSTTVRDRLSTFRSQATNTTNTPSRRLPSAKGATDANSALRSCGRHTSTATSQSQSTSAQRDPGTDDEHGDRA
jgi:mannitol-specific phosphotransferase system IIBC component